MASGEASTEVPVCPECRAGKHPNCDGTAWDDQTDHLTTCTCAQRGHQ